MKTGDIGKLLRENSAARPLRPAGEFWSEFEGRARGAERLAPAPRGRGASWFYRAALPALAAAAALVLAFVWVDVAPGADAAVAVRSYELGPDLEHNGVLILADEESKATILWIADCEDVGDDTSGAKIVEELVK